MMPIESLLTTTGTVSTQSTAPLLRMHVSRAARMGNFSHRGTGFQLLAALGYAAIHTVLRTSLSPACMRSTVYCSMLYPPPSIASTSPNGTWQFEAICIPELQLAQDASLAHNGHLAAPTPRLACCSTAARPSSACLGCLPGWVTDHRESEFPRIHGGCRQSHGI